MIREFLSGLFNQTKYSYVHDYKPHMELVGVDHNGDKRVIAVDSDIRVLSEIKDSLETIQKDADKLADVKLKVKFYGFLKNLEIREVRNNLSNIICCFISVDLNKKNVDEIAIEVVDREGYGDEGSYVDFTDYKSHKLVYVITHGYNLKTLLEDAITAVKGMHHREGSAVPKNKLAGLKNKLLSILSSDINIESN